MHWKFLFQRLSADGWGAVVIVIIVNVIDFNFFAKLKHLINIKVRFYT